MGAYSEAKARGYPVMGEVFVIYDGQVWNKMGRDEEHRYCIVGDVKFTARVVGPRCWRLTAEKRPGGVEVLRVLVGSLNAAKLRAAMFVRAQPVWQPHPAPPVKASVLP